MRRLSLTGLLVLFLVSLVIGGALWRLGDQRAQTAALTETTAPAEFGGPFSLTDQDGMRRSDMDFRGKYMLIFFGFTYCPDVCPTTLAVQAEALDQLGPAADRIVPIFITVDPNRDTPEKLKSYLSAFDARPPAARPGFVGLTGTDEEIAQVAAAYRVYYRAHADGRSGNVYSVDHTGNVYLMGPDGKFVAYYSQGILPDEMAADLRLKTSG
jgi:protein SCO1/2